MSTGVYTITCLPTGKRYVGSAAISFAKRFAQHRHELRRGTHKSTYMQRAWIKYGESAFEFKAVEHTKPADAVAVEQRWIDELRPEFNTALTAGSSLGIKRNFSPEKRAQIAEQRRRINLSKPDRNAGHLLEIVKSPEFRAAASTRIREGHQSGRYTQANKLRGERMSKLHDTPEGRLTKKQICDRFGLQKKTLEHRIKMGVQGVDLIKPPRRCLVVVDGAELTASEFAHRHGLTVKVARSRIERKLLTGYRLTNPQQIRTHR